MTDTVEGLRTRYPQLRGLEDGTIAARADDFREALRARYGVAREDEAADAAIARVVRTYFGWWMLYMDRITAESVSATGASTTHGAPLWPADIADMLAAVSDAPPASVTQLTR